VRKEGQVAAVHTDDGNEAGDAPKQVHLNESDISLEDRYHRPLVALFDKTSDVVVAIKDDFTIVDVNASAEVVFGQPGKTNKGKNCATVLECRNLNRMVLCGTSSCPLVRVIQTMQPLANEEMIIGKATKHLCEVSASVTPVVVDGQPCAVFIARDMSALNVANRVRSNFVSMVSHELRTPLNSVHGFIDLLLQGHMGNLTDEQSLYLGYTQEGVDQLISIVEDILFMTRSDLGQFEVKQQKVNLHSLVRQVLSSLQPQALKAEIELGCTVSVHGPDLSVDPQRIKQVLNNLVANAIKFTPPGGTITIGSRPHDELFEMITVSDTGYGIPIEDRRHIFERFYQSNHSLQSKMGGYGLGLSIAKLIVEQHGGTIGFDTVMNKGTTFYFTLPLHMGQVEA
jgi:signal transduction histidine kinase